MNAWNGKRAFIVDPEGDLRTCVCTCLYEFVYTAMLKIKQNYTQISIKIQPKIIPKSVKNRPKNRPKIDQKSIPRRLQKRGPSWGRLGTVFGSFLNKKYKTWCVFISLCSEIVKTHHVSTFFVARLS